MAKILAQAGVSLADIYNVVGSIAGIEELISREVHPFHEMGTTIFSERVSADIIRATSGDILQNTDFDVVLDELGEVPSRLLGVCVLTDAVARLNYAQISVRDPTTEREIPLFVWDNNESSMVARIQENGAALTNWDYLASPLNGPAVPSMLFSTRQPLDVNEIAFRGRSAGFGAGTVEVVALLYQAGPQLAGLSSRGLPLPSW